LAIAAASWTILCCSCDIQSHNEDWAGNSWGAAAIPPRTSNSAAKGLLRTAPRPWRRLGTATDRPRRSAAMTIPFARKVVRATARRARPHLLLHRPLPTNRLAAVPRDRRHLQTKCQGCPPPLALCASGGCHVPRGGTPEFGARAAAESHHAGLRPSLMGFELEPKWQRTTLRLAEVDRGTNRSIPPGGRFLPS
jgi:hypothetical protein